MQLDGAIAGANAQKAAIGKGIPCLFHLPCPALKEPVDPLFHMIQCPIGRPQPQRGQRDNTDHQQHGQAGKKHLETPGNGHQKGHADIGLQHQDANENGHQRR